MRRKDSAKLRRVKVGGAAGACCKALCRESKAFRSGIGAAGSGGVAQGVGMRTAVANLRPRLGELVFFTSLSLSLEKAYYIYPFHYTLSPQERYAFLSDPNEGTRGWRRGARRGLVCTVDLSMDGYSSLGSSKGPSSTIQVKSGPCYFVQKKRALPCPDVLVPRSVACVLARIRWRAKVAEEKVVGAAARGLPYTCL